MTTRSVLILLLFVYPVTHFGQRPDAGSKQSRIDSLLKTIYTNDAPGVSIAVVQRGSPVFKRSYGIANLETKINLDSTTNFNIASLTKQFTALAILQLVDRKKLSLDDPLSKFFPEFNKRVAEGVTVEELLTHSSGIIDHYDLSDTKNMKHAHINDVLDAIKNTDSSYFIPGSHYRYSNTAYNLLALIIQKISGMSYAEYLQKNIFAPLQMDRTAVWNELLKIKNEASGYEFDKTTNNFKESGARENIFFSTEGDGGIYTSIDDYLKWFEGLQSARICSETLIRQARSPQFPVDKNNHLSYGFGWFVDQAVAPDRVFHSGSNGGFRAYSYSIPSKNFLIVIFSNRDDIDLEELVKKIYQILDPSAKS